MNTNCFSASAGAGLKTLKLKYFKVFHSIVSCPSLLCYIVVPFFIILFILWLALMLTKRVANDTGWSQTPCRQVLCKLSPHSPANASQTPSILPPSSLCPCAHSTLPSCTRAFGRRAWKVLLP